METIIKNKPIFTTSSLILCLDVEQLTWFTYTYSDERKACRKKNNIYICTVPYRPEEGFWLSATFCNLRHEKLQANQSLRWLIWNFTNLQMSCWCNNTTNAHLTSAWNDFRFLLPLITNRGVFLKDPVSVLTTCIRKILLYG